MGIFLSVIVPLGSFFLLSQANAGENPSASPLYATTKQNVQDLEALLPQIQTLQASDELPPAGRDQELAKINAAAAQILAKAPEDPQVLTAAARVSMQLGDNQTAVNRATLALNHLPDDPGARATRALAYYAVCDFPKAHADAQAALKAAPGDPVALSILKLSNRPKGCSGLTVEAQVQLKERLADFLKVPPPAPKGYTREGYLEFAKRLDRADTELAAKDYGAAYRDATWALIEFPENPRALLQRVQAAMGMKGYREAEADATRGLKLKSDSWQFLSSRAMARNETGRFRDALADASHAIRLKPDVAEAWLVRAMASQKLGEPAKSYLEDYRRAADLDGRYQPLYDAALGQVRVEIGPGALLNQLRAALASIKGLMALTFLAIALLGAALISVAIALWRRSSERSAVWSGVVPENGTEVAVGSYQIGGVIGRGGMGTVYEGFDKHLDRKVAVKELQASLRNDKRERERFLQEARLVAALSHPNIVAIHAVVREELRVLLIFEFVEGKTLEQALDLSPGRRIAPQDALPIIAQVCAALEYAHSKRIIHRDLKPSNIMIAAGLAKVMDFGIARRAKDSMRARTGTVAGTPFYMAPEMEEGKASPQSDLYSLAVTLYEVLAGCLPFTDAGLQRQKESAHFPRVSERDTSLPRELDAFFKKALAPKPEDRYQTAAQFREAFAKAIGAA